METLYYRIDRIFSRYWLVFKKIFNWNTQP